MRNLMVISSLFFVAACGLSQEKFEEQFAEKFCEEWAACNTTTECPTGTGTGTGTTECDFDKAAAKDCLDGEWTCNTDFPGFEFPVPPAACADVCGAATGTTPTETTTGTM